MFKKIKLFNLVLIVLVGLMFINLNEMKAFSGSATLSLDGVNVTVLESNVDPITVKGGETTVGNLVVVEFTHNQASGNDVLMYTTKWPFKSTDVRPGAYEYAFSKEGSNFVLTEKSTGGNLEIPFNGFVISSKQDVWGNVQVGTKLSSSLDIPTYAGAVEIEGTGEYAGETRRDIRIAIDDKNKKRNVYETIYYNNEWGTETGQNEFGVEIEQYQSNHEGDLVDKIQAAYNTYDAIVINPAAYTHTSIAILDALKAVALPAVEVHISDVDSREDFRKISYAGMACVKTIKGMGLAGYKVAIQHLISNA